MAAIYSINNLLYSFKTESAFSNWINVVLTGCPPGVGLGLPEFVYAGIEGKIRASYSFYLMVD